MSFWEQNKEYFIEAIIAIVVLLVAWLISKGIKRAINRFSRSRNLAEQDPGAETRFRMIQRLSSVILFFVAVGIIFWIVDSETLNQLATAMFATGGIVAVALAFAAQSTVANLVSGVIIAFVQPIRLGDRVDIDQDYGVVESIGLFYTQIRTWDNRRLLIPNKILSDQTIRNYTLVDARMPAIVTIRLEYGADIEFVRQTLLAEAQAHPLFLPDPPPKVEVVDADDLGVTVRLSAYAENQGDAWTMAVELRESVIKKLAAADAPVGVRWSQIMSLQTPTG
jgi:small-conductance mechanosensitive channel